MKAKVIILSTLSLALIIIFFISKDKILGTPITVFRTGVRIGNISLSRKTWEEASPRINRIFDKPIYLNTETASRAITMEEIGIGLDKDRLFRYTQVCRYANFRVLCKNTSNEPVDTEKLLLIDIEKLNQYLAQVETELQTLAQNTILSFEDYTFRAPGNNTQIGIDPTPFSSKENLAKLITQDTIKLKIVTQLEEDISSQHQNTLELVGTITKPLLIKYGGTPLYIPQETVKKFIGTKEQDAFLYGVISTEEISNYLNELKAQYETKEVKVLHEDAIRAIANALLLRSADYAVNNAVILPLEGLPKTNGELYDVYLEVVKSQQRLYRFEHGKLTKTYIISTGLTWDTPAGNHSILGKQKMTISYFGNWYMPNYLPIGTINGAYKFGFHAIPYHMDASGNIYSRDENTMGSPATGGCIQLHYNDSLELFNWAPIGTPVYVYE